MATTARAWRDPEHPARVEAVRQTRAAPNRFTEEALAFAVNAAMHRLTPAALRGWWGARHAAPDVHTVGVEPGGATPLSGLRAVLAVILAGHRCLLHPPEASPALVPTFAEAVREQQEAADAQFARAGGEEVFAGAQAAIGAASDEKEAGAESFRQRCEAAGIAPARRHWRGARCSVAVLDGGEDEAARDGLAEDALLYEGRGGGSVRLIWAPAGTSPDAYLDAMARFRAVFPAHPDTPGSLKMQQAFLEAQDQPHAHGEGLEFLMSRGAPAVQAPGHVRWAEYETLDTVNDWLRAYAAGVRAVVARPEGGRQGLHPPPAMPVLAPGTTHRQLLEAPGASDVLGVV